MANASSSGRGGTSTGLQREGSEHGHAFFSEWEKETAPGENTAHTRKSKDSWTAILVYNHVIGTSSS